MNPSQIIHRMMGGEQFLLATRVERVIVTTQCVTYKLPENKSTATHCSISLSASGRYNLQFFKHAQSITLATYSYLDRELSMVPGIFRQVTDIKL